MSTKAAANKPAATKPMRRVDLTGKERQLRGSILAMTKIGVEFARACRRSLPFLVRYGCTLKPGTVEIVTSAADFATEPSDQNYPVNLTTADGRSWGAIRLDAGAIAFVLEGTLGGRGTFVGSEERFQLSSAQRSLMARVSQSIAMDFAHSVAKSCGLTLAPIDMVNDKMPDTGDILRLTCQIEGLPMSAAIIIAVSAPALENATKDHAAEGELPVSGDPRIGEALQEVSLELRAELGRTTLGLKRVLSLQAGDIIRLPTATDDPLTIRVGGLEKFHGVPIISRGQNAIEIRSRHEP